MKKHDAQLVIELVQAYARPIQGDQLARLRDLSHAELALLNSQPAPPHYSQHVGIGNPPSGFDLNGMVHYAVAALEAGMPQAAFHVLRALQEALKGTP